jgi:hypothetical protein
LVKKFLSRLSPSSITKVTNTALNFQKPEKKGLFSKMFQSVKLFSTKNKKKAEQPEENETENESDDESDDYQTIYRKEPTKDTRYPTTTRTVTRSKTQPQNRNQDMHERLPYMEQEYRRYWNEKLAFHEKQRRHSKATRSRDTRRTPDPVYWQNYEARSALIGQNRDGSRTPRYSSRKFIPPPSRRTSGPKLNVATKGLSWLKKHKPQCGEQWKKFILES